MSDEARVQVSGGDDVIGRRRLVASVDRARTFGGNSFSGVLDIVGGLIVVASLVATLTLAVTGPEHSYGPAWLDEFLVLVAGVSSGLLLMSLSRLVLYGKACAVLLARLSDERS